MAHHPLRVLHVEDDFADAMLVHHAVCEAGDFDIDFEVVRTLRDAKKRLSRGEFDLVLLDLRLPDSLHPAETLETTRSCCGKTPVMVLSGSMSVDAGYMPTDIRALDKNESFKTERGEPPTHLARCIREAAGDEDIETI